MRRFCFVAKASLDRGPGSVLKLASPPASQLSNVLFAEPSSCAGAFLSQETAFFLVSST